MNSGIEETKETIRARLNILEKSLVSERNSVSYYETLIEKTPGNSEEDIGSKRMYEDLRDEEIQHVAKIESLIQHWKAELNKFDS